VETTIILSLEPLFGAAFAAAVVGERFGWGGVVGATLILSGCIFSNIGKEGKNDNENFVTNDAPSDEMEAMRTSAVSSTIAGATGSVISILQDRHIDEFPTESLH